MRGGYNPSISRAHSFVTNGIELSNDGENSDKHWHTEDTYKDARYPGDMPCEVPPSSFLGTFQATHIHGEARNGVGYSGGCTLRAHMTSEYRKCRAEAIILLRRCCTTNPVDRALELHYRDVDQRLRLAVFKRQHAHFLSSPYSLDSSSCRSKESAAREAVGPPCQSFARKPPALPEAL